MFLPITPLSRNMFFIGSLWITIILFLSGLCCSYVSDFSPFFWNLTLALSFVWFIWTIVATIFKLYERLIFRILPLTILFNISSIFGMLTYWRAVEEDQFFGVLLSVSYFSALLFSYFNPKFIFTFHYRMDSPKVLAFLLIYGSLPIIWYIYGLQIVDFSKIYLYAWGIACGSMFFTFLFTAMTIRYREPDWTPQEELKRKGEGKWL